MKAPVFILGVHKSGTTLMRNLLDGHPDLFSIPFETHWFELMGEWIWNAYRTNQPEDLGSQGWVERAVESVERINSIDDTYSDSAVMNRLDVEAFERSIRSAGEIHDRKSFIEAYVKAIKVACGRQGSDDARIVEKSVENAEFAIDLANMFPEAKFVHILRNPYSNFVSLRKFKGLDHGYPLLNRMVETMKSNYYFLYKNRKVLSRRYKVVKYENLVQRPKEEMSRIADFLDIEFTDSLITPTVMGEDWGGNSMTGMKTKGISASRLTAFVEEIHPMEVKAVNSAFSGVVRDFGYEQLDEGKGYWKKAKGESMPRYFYNRLYKFYNRDYSAAKN